MPHFHHPPRRRIYPSNSALRLSIADAPRLGPQTNRDRTSHEKPNVYPNRLIPTPFEHLPMKNPGTFARVFFGSDAAHSRRRGDRIEMPFAAMRWSLMALSGHSNRARVCPLLDQSGQRLVFLFFALPTRPCVPFGRSATK